MCAFVFAFYARESLKTYGAETTQRFSNFTLKEEEETTRDVSKNM